FDRLATTVCTLVDRPGEAVTLPVDAGGTAFQQAVWQALRAIPPGETRSYGEIAAAAGKPGAVRAAGSACGANPIAIVVPCHRVLRADGALGGYGYGVDRKQSLLAREQKKD
ncbi:MAG: methylated-DNA--[protein]-cysteine S-methyltransferase, partial [Sphingobium sp.]